MKKRKKKFFICCNNITWKHGCVVCELQCSYTVDQRAAGLRYKALSYLSSTVPSTAAPSEVAPWGALRAVGTGDLVASSGA